MISPLEIQRFSILNHEGKTKKVKAVSELILFEGEKAWIGGGMINGEPISRTWLEKLGFTQTHEFVWGNGKLELLFNFDESVFCIGHWGNIRYQYIHQLQLQHFAITGEHIKLPKIK